MILEHTKRWEKRSSGWYLLVTVHVDGMIHSTVEVGYPAYDQPGAELKEELEKKALDLTEYVARFLKD